ncbi:uroporphyrinogen-III C-methyltransferase [Yinghuangia sp. ASG 101]|uniref:uroporphyrinogen-III C-methyltransferase n=1 Tax=Yinghuangia sp. ASG 101 TaxID=2896848 RepID=UPI001E575927|nr:uroporphyrinogen-III C-methyltransferase [Yinghuangia sp. ASG 101]UGQ10739.1 uroporphyrinogen-III C-methyltransferase [Yinghuangia sp. ASG 101]
MSPKYDDVPAYPAGLRLAGRKVVMVGAGAVARRRLAGLVDAQADVLVVAPAATPSVEAMADDGELRWERRGYRADDLEGAWYVVAATDDTAVNAAVEADAEARRIFCVRSDDASHASAWTPASGRHDGLQIAVLAGGDPRRAAAVRDRILEGMREGALGAAHFRGKKAGVALVGGGPGDPDLITVRGRRLLAEADVVVTDRLGPRALLDELASDVEVIDAAKIPYGRAMAQDAINNEIVKHASAGKFVVRLKGGDNYVFGRGFEEAIACAAAGIPVEVVPGITSAISVPAIAGIPVTHRGVAHEFTVVSGHVAPDSPESLVDWAALGRLRGTLVLLMAMERLGAIAETLIAHGRDAATPVAVVQEGTMATQRTLRTTLARAAADVREEGLRPPAIVVVGEVVAVADQIAR